MTTAATQSTTLGAILERVSAARLATLIANTAKAAPQLGTRPEMAAGIIALGRIAPDPDGDPNHFLVSGTSDEPYRVRLEGDEDGCSCPDYSRRAPEVRGRRLCKHLLAACILGHIRDREPKAEPRPEQQARPNLRVVRLSCHRQRAMRVHEAARPRVRVPLTGRLAAV